MKKNLKTLFILIVSGAMITMTGCKETDVLKEIIYQEDQPIVDEEQTQVDNDADNQQEDDTQAPKKKTKDSKQKEEKDKTEAKKGKNQDKTEDVASVDYDENSKQTVHTKKKKASSDDQQETDDQESFDDLDQGGETDYSEDSDDKSNKPTSTDKGDQSGTKVVPGDEASSVDITDSNGEEVDVNQADTVAAVDEIAVFVEMLGGSDRLIATSESLTTNAMAKTVFEDMGSVAAWWSGDGSSPMSDANFKKLKKAKPDMVIYESGKNTFTAKQLKQLQNAGIDTTALYPMNTPEHIRANVTVLGKILGNRASEGMKNAKDLAKAYNTWSKDVESEFSGSHFTDYTLSKYLDGAKDWSSQGEGKYTLLVQHWDDTASVKVYSNKNKYLEEYSGGAGGSDAGFSGSPVSYYMSIANVVNSSAASSQILSNQKDGVWYVSQWVNGAGIVKISGKYRDYRASDEAAGPLLAQVKLSDIKTDIRAHLGTEEFPAVIAGSKTIKKNLAKSRLMTTDYNTYDKANKQYGYSITDTIFMKSSIQLAKGHMYDIYVNPYGVSCWYNGSAESPLECYWIAWKFGTGNVSESQLRSAIADFYSTFYDYSIGANSKEMDQILDGSYVPSCREK